MPIVITANVDGKIVKTVANKDDPRCPYSQLPWRLRKYRCKGKLVRQVEYLPGYVLQVICTENIHHCWVGKIEAIKEWKPTEHQIQTHIQQIERLSGNGKPPTSTVYPLK